MADQSCDTNRPHNRRDLILDTAQVLFARDGYGSTGIRAIAAEVGISEATIYHYFRSKDEILDGIINRTAEGQLQVYRFPAEMCLKEVLYNVGTMFLKVMEASENRDLIQLLLTESAHDQRRAELYLSRIWDQGLQALEEAIAERLPGRPTITAATIAKMLLGSLTCFVVHNETLAAVAGRPLENELDPGRWEYLDQVIGILLYGIEGGNASAPNV
jgi:AcrR family transcriptional regulator